MFENKNIIVYDIETTSLNIHETDMKWFGAYSYLHDEYYLLQFPRDKKDIIELLKEHKVLVGFNNKNFDNPIIEANLALEENIFEYKVIVDLLEISAPKGGKDYGIHRKNRLALMGYKLKNFTLKKIIEELKLDKDIGTKGDIDYNIFKKDEWTSDEITEIKKYLKQDIDLTKSLFQWYESQFFPLKKLLPQKAQDNFLYLKSSLAVVAYNIICHKAGLELVFGERMGSTESFAGGHHIDNRFDLVKGNICEIDLVACYPHMIMMGNLCSPVSQESEGWNGDGYYKLDGKYNKKEQGKIELALKDIFLERLKAKKEKDIPKDKSYKIIINSMYGTLGNPVFKSIYNRNSASDCTSMARTVLKKIAQTLDIEGFSILGGFTDSIFVLIPEGLDKNDLMHVLDECINEATSHTPQPMDTFKMGIEEEIKMIWFVQKNCYLFVTQKDEIIYKSTLLNTNTPAAVMKLFETYMKPIIITTLSIPFTKKELEDQIKIILEKEPTLGTQEYNVTDLNDYKLKTSIQYQISEKYGKGRHYLIPNRKGIGVGLAKNSKKQAGLRYCTMDEFKKVGLKVSDIELTHLISHLKPFYEKNEIKPGPSQTQTTL